MAVSEIRETARGILRKLFQLQTETLGRRPRIEEFFPLDAKTVVRQVLAWELEITDGVRAADGIEVAGRCFFERRRIELDRRRTEVEQRFTLAHEIGHAVLHSAAPACGHSGAERARSVRRAVPVILSPDAIKAEREANIFAAELTMPPRAVARTFSELFGRPRIWVESKEIRSVCPHYFSARREMSGPPEPKDIAGLVASTAPSAGVVSLAQRFGVSGGAMGIRLMELGLVY